MADRADEKAALPLILEAICGDCGTTTRLRHPSGIGGADLPGWRCAVCLSPLAFSTPSWAWTDRAPGAACDNAGPPEATSTCVAPTGHVGEHRDDSGGTWPTYRTLPGSPS